MQRVILDIEDSKFEQFIAMIDLLNSDVVKKFQVQKTDDEFKINEKHCLEVLDKINRGDYTGIEPIGDIDEYIAELKNAIR